MFLKRIILAGLAAGLLVSTPAWAEKTTLMEVLFPKKTEQAEAAKPAGKKQKLSAKEKAAQKRAAEKAAKAEAKKAAQAKGKKNKLAARDAEQPAPKRKKGLLPGVAFGQEAEGASTGDVTLVGNNGELRSEQVKRKPGLFSGLLGDDEPQMLPETQALDRVLASRDAQKAFAVKDEFVPQEVAFSGYAPGTVVIDTRKRFLYLVETASTARRYAIAVGRDGLQFKGEVKVGDKQEWPRWIPTAEMQAREPKKYGRYKDGMPGGPDNPLGARAMYLHLGKKDTYLRIHGTNQPESIGSASSNGCFRMVNEHVMDLYRRVPVGTQVIVM
ncbi:MAG TPA: L,D-transpeptidase [Mesorhizobium sp.]|jgi:lipoprotein-anchoring transpeptidase ErfK/SrfK|nr:L,D-transpeptidase [Mesorhizobium sp.]